VYPVSANSIALYRRRLDREWRLMTCLATPYISRDTERAYIETHGTLFEQTLAKFAHDEHTRMPGKPKDVKVRGVGGRPHDEQDAEGERRKGNVGNLLHTDRTVEEQLKRIVTHTRFD